MYGANKTFRITRNFYDCYFGISVLLTTHCFFFVFLTTLLTYRSSAAKKGFLSSPVIVRQSSKSQSLAQDMLKMN